MICLVDLVLSRGYLCFSDASGLWWLLEWIQTLQKFVESFSPLLCLWDASILPPVERGLQQLQRLGKTQNTDGQGTPNFRHSSRCINFRHKFVSELKMNFYFCNFAACPADEWEKSSGRAKKFHTSVDDEERPSQWLAYATNPGKPSGPLNHCC